MPRREPSPPIASSLELARPQKAGKPGRGKPDSAPRLRDRLFEVLERDRALADSQQSFSDAESGTRVRPPEVLRDARSIEPLDARAQDAAEGISLQVWNSAPLDSLDDWLRDVSEVDERDEQVEQGEQVEADEQVEDDELDVPTGVTRFDGALLLEDDGTFGDEAALFAAEGVAQPAETALHFADWIAEELTADDVEPLSAPVVITPPVEARKSQPRASGSSQARLSGVTRPSAKTRAEQLAREPSSAELALAITTDVPAEHDSYPPDAPAALAAPEVVQGLSVGSEPPAAVAGAALPVDEEVAASAAPEPIVTRTMARLLAGHGYRARALAIYDELLRRKPDDAELREEAEALRASGK